MTRINQFDQPIGEPIIPCKTKFKLFERLQGESCYIQPLQENNISTIADCYRLMPEQDWTYLPYEQPTDLAQAKTLVNQFLLSKDPYHMVIFDLQGNALGTVALMRIDNQNRTVEIGYVIYGNQLKRTKIATEAQFLLMQYVFDELKFRRYEWKCDSLNIPSRRAAERLGFQYEGTFRQLVIYKGRSRDTAWFSIIDSEWQPIKQGFKHYLKANNFTNEGVQLSPLKTRSI